MGNPMPEVDLNPMAELTLSPSQGLWILPLATEAGGLVRQPYAYVDFIPQ
jgi:hypothetical protein